MNTNIDKRLQEILEHTNVRACDDPKCNHWIYTIPDAQAAIHKVFKDAGYVQKEWRSTGTINGQRFEHKEVLTGAEWLERFTKEYSSLKFNRIQEQDIDALNAARRASGLEEDSHGE
jgi:hypothetical protein